MLNKIVISISAMLISLVFIFSCEKKEPKSIKEAKSLEKEIQSAKFEIKPLSSSESLTTAINNSNYFSEYQIGKYKHVKQNDLSDLVNGADGTYIAKGVTEAGSLELSHKLTKLPVIITVFTVGKDKNASEIYNTEKSGDSKTEKIGVEGYYANDNQLLVFWKAKYYVKLEIQKKTSADEGKSILQKLSETLNKLIQ
ncbi:MAG: hypothetical protein OEV44_14585 [Spirochaetota bacterium]|nr:hypothetical protein [Spirochaetota bacterium]